MDDATILDPQAAPVQLVPVEAGIPDGLYFGMADDAIYHPSPALGSGDVRQLCKAAIYFWRDSHMNPMRKARAETPALRYGRALHKLGLEGLEAFTAAYARAPLKSDYPGALETQADLSAALKDAGEKVSGSKAEQVARLLAVRPDAVIWERIASAATVEALKAGKSMLAADEYDRVIVEAGFLLSNPSAAAALSGGMPEVSIFWTADNGVKCKARLDYLRLGKRGERLIGVVADIKTYASWSDEAPERAVVKAISTYRLDVQAAHYLNGCAKIPEFIAAGAVFGAEKVAPEWLAVLGQITPADWQFSWIFASKEAPISLLRHVTPGSDLMNMAAADVARALDVYKENVDVYGQNWLFVDPIPDGEVTLQDLPPWHGR